MSDEVRFAKDEFPVCAAYFSMSRDETAKKLRTGAGSVSRTWDKLKGVCGPEAENLRNLSLKFKKDKITLEQAIEGSAVSRLLDQYGVSNSSDLEKVLQPAAEIMKDSNLDIADLLTCAKQMLDAEAKNGMTYLEQVEKLKSLASQVTSLEQQIQKLSSEASDAEEEKRNSLESSEVTEGQLKEYVETRDSLKKLGVNVRDFPKLGAMLRNPADEDFDAKKIVARISSNENLIAESNRHEADIERKKSESKTLDTEIASGNERLGIVKISISQAEDTFKKISQEYNPLILATLSSFQTQTNTAIEKMSNSLTGAAASFALETGKVEAALQKAGPIVENFSTSIEKAGRINEDIAAQNNIRRVYELITNGAGSEIEVLSLILVIMRGFQRWLEQNNLGSTTQNIGQAVISIIDLAEKYVSTVGTAQ